MQKGIKHSFFCSALLLMLINNSYGQESEDESKQQNNWQCSALDADQQTFIGQGHYETKALGQAYELCKKESKFPLSCKVSKANCEVSPKKTQSANSRPLWRCLALDQMAEHWQSGIYSNRDEAAINAKDFCQSNSTFPDTCYVHLMTCTNLSASL